MQITLSVFQIILSILLSLAVLSQNNGTGLDASFGGSGTVHATKRGAEKVLSRATLIIAILFVLNSIAFLFV